MRNVFCHFRHMLLDIAHECRAAGGGQEALFRQLLRFLLCDHIRAECGLDNVVEAEMAQCLLDLSDSRALELGGNCRSDNRNGIVAAVVCLLDQLDCVYHIGIIDNRAERALAHAGAAADALIVIDFRFLLAVPLEGADLAAAFARTDILGDCAIRAYLCTASAMDALLRINLCTSVIALADRTARAYLHAAVCQTATAGVADRITVDRTFVTRNIDDLDDVASALTAECVMYTFTDNRALLVDTAAHGRLFARNDLLRHGIIAVVQPFLQCMLCDGAQNLIFY